MKWTLATLPLIALAACSENKTDTFTCPNGPDLAVAYTAESATLSFSDGRTEVLPRDASREGLYAKPGMVWDIVAFRTARLTDGQRSFNCDQTSIRRFP